MRDRRSNIASLTRLNSDIRRRRRASKLSGHLGHGCAFELGSVCLVLIEVLVMGKRKWEEEINE
jgi:hypothetical protein